MTNSHLVVLALIILGVVVSFSAGFWSADSGARDAIDAAYDDGYDAGRASMTPPEISLAHPRTRHKASSGWREDTAEQLSPEALDAACAAPRASRPPRRAIRSGPLSPDPAAPASWDVSLSDTGTWHLIPPPVPRDLADAIPALRRDWAA